MSYNSFVYKDFPMQNTKKKKFLFFPIFFKSERLYVEETKPKGIKSLMMRRLIGARQRNKGHPRYILEIL